MTFACASGVRRRLTVVALVVCLLAGVAGCGEEPAQRSPAGTQEADLPLRDKVEKRASHDEASIRRMLERKGATAAQSRAIVEALARRLAPDEMHVWLADPTRSHPVPDPESAKRFEDAGLVAATLDRTPVNAVGAGKADLVVAEARRFAAEE